VKGFRFSKYRIKLLEPNDIYIYIYRMSQEERTKLREGRTLFIYQLTHTTLRSVELLKHSKIDKIVCFNNSTLLTVVCVSW